MIFFIVSCSSEIKSDKADNDESANCAQELSSILNRTEFLNSNGEIIEICEYKPNWLPNYTDSNETSGALFLELKSDSIFHVMINCSYRNDKYCQHEIYSIPQLNNHDYINFTENVTCDASFLVQCGFKIHHHFHKVNTTLLKSGSPFIHQDWFLDSASVDTPVFNYISMSPNITGIIRSKNTKSGFRAIDLPFSQMGTALNHQDSSEFILHCLISTEDNLVLEDRKIPEEPIQYYFSNSRK